MPGPRPSENADEVRARVATSFDSPAKRAAFINEDKTGITNWHQRTGQFFPEWDENRHVVTDFYPPGWWYRFRTFDWGTAEPFAVYWVAVSDGNPFRDEDGVERWFPRGALIYYDEWYGCDDGHANPEDNHPERGNRMRNEDIAQGIVLRSEHDFKDVITLTDNKPFQDMGGEGIAETFKKNGCLLTQGDTSRVAGWSQMRGRFIGQVFDTNALDEEGKPIRIPMIYICARCRYARDYIPQLPGHPSEGKKEDAAESGEATHSNDAIRLGCMAHTNAVIKDYLAPVSVLIARELRGERPTVQGLVDSLGSGLVLT